MENYKEPTEAEIREYQEKMDKYYDDRLPFLRKKHEFDTLTADIDEARVRSIEARNRLAQYAMQSQEAQKKVEPEKVSDKKEETNGHAS